MGSILQGPFREALGLPLHQAIYHVAVMQCYDKKLEASRPDFKHQVGSVRIPFCVNVAERRVGATIGCGHGLGCHWACWSHRPLSHVQCYCNASHTSIGYAIIDGRAIRRCVAARKYHITSHSCRRIFGWIPRLHLPIRCKRALWPHHRCHTIHTGQESWHPRM